MTPDDDTHGSDRYWRTSGGQDILAIKEPTNSGWSGCLDGQGTDCSGRFGYSTALRETDGKLYFNNTAACFCLTTLAESGMRAGSWMTRTTPGFEGLAIDEQGHKDGSAIEDKDTRRARRYVMHDVLFLLLCKLI